MSLVRTRRSLGVALFHRDAYTEAHCGRVEWLAMALGRACGLDLRHLTVLTAGARLHDVGKIGVPDAVLLKPGPLDAAEWAVMREHPVVGGRICEALDHPEAPMVAQAVHHHHEAWMGGGYPDGISGEAIPICARVIALADAYDAMTTRRAYRGERSHEEAIAILRHERGVRSDPWVYDRFERLLADPELRERLRLQPDPGDAPGRASAQDH